MKRSRRKAAAAAVAGLLVAALAACGSSDEEEDGGSGPITLGLVGPTTGVLAEIGKNQVAGAEVAVAEINEAGGIDGRELELEVRDEGLAPDKAAAAIRGLADDGVQLQLGMLSSADCLAVAPTLERLQVVMVVSGCTNDDLTGVDGAEAPFPNVFRTGNNDTALAANLTTTIAEKYPEVTDYDAFAYDYVTGTTQWDMFQEIMADEGISLNIGKEFFVPFDEVTFKSYVQALASQGGDPAKKGLYVGTYGAGTASFLKQAQDFDLAKEYALIMQPGGYYPVARTMNGNAPEVWSAYDYNYAAFDSEMNQGFVAAVEQKLGTKPVSWTYDAYLSVYAYKAAIEEAGTAEYGAVLDALPGIEFDSPAGKLTIDATTHQASTPVVVMHSVGDKNATEGVKMIDTVVVTRED